MEIELNFTKSSAQNMRLYFQYSLSLCLSAFDLPLYTVSCCQHVTIVDQHSSAIEPVEVAKTSHPGKFIHARCLSTNDTTFIIPFATS